MKKRVLIVLTALFALLNACAEEPAVGTSEDTIFVYRILRPEYQVNGELLRPEKIPLNGTGDPVSQAASALADSPKSDRLQSPMPEGVIIIKTEHKENFVTVYMNSAYLEADAIDRSVLDSCIVLTMCSIKNIDYVSICVGNDVIADRLTTDDILLSNTITSPKKAKVRLYFPKKGENILCSEYRPITIDNDNSAERRILDALLEGPENAALRSAFPDGTIVLSVYTQDGICTVSLSGIFPDDATKSKDDGMLAAYSIVNSLASLADVQSVQILIDGTHVRSLWGFDISRPLVKNESIIGSSVA